MRSCVSHVCTGAALADFLRDVLLAEMKLACQAGKGARLLDRVQVFALKILDEREFEHLLIGGFTDDHRRLRQPRPLRRPPAAFPGDEFKLVAAFAGDQRLDDPVLFDRGDEFVQMVVAENGARLERRRHDPREVHDLHPLPAFQGGSRRGDTRIDERAESFAESGFCHKCGEATESSAKGNGGRLSRRASRLRWRK